MTQTKKVEWEKVQSWRFWDAGKKEKAVVALKRALGISEWVEPRDALRPNDLNHNILIREEYQLGPIFKAEVVVTRLKHRVTVTLLGKKGYKVKVKLPDIEKICK